MTLEVVFVTHTALSHTNTMDLLAFQSKSWIWKVPAAMSGQRASLYVTVYA